MAKIKSYNEFLSDTKIYEGRNVTENFIHTNEEYRKLGERLKGECEAYLLNVCRENGGVYVFGEHGIEGLCITNDRTNSACSEIYDIHIGDSGRLFFRVDGTDEYPFEEIVSVGEISSIAEEIHNMHELGK